MNSSHQNLSYAENFMYMLDRMSNPSYKPHPRLAKALDVLFILHAEHEMNCSTAAMRHLASSGVDVYSSLAGSAAALYGPAHGGANSAVIYMLQKIGNVANIPTFIADVKAKKAKLMVRPSHLIYALFFIPSASQRDIYVICICHLYLSFALTRACFAYFRLQGFGHRVYKNYDPRARIIKSLADEVFSIIGRDPLIEIAIELERIALSDKYFVERKLYPNVDFYSGLIYKAMGFPTDFFTVLFAIPRTAGWLAHWAEFLDDPENNILRPRQVYLGSKKRDYADVEGRAATSKSNISSELSAEAKRRLA